MTNNQLLKKLNEDMKMRNFSQEIWEHFPNLPFEKNTVKSSA